MTGRAPFDPNPLGKTLDVVTRAARAGQALTYGQLNERLGGTKKVIEKYVRALAEQNLVVIDQSCRPYLIRPAPEARA
jgi:hypothetical protein